MYSLPSKTVVVASSKSSSKKKIGPIVGGVVGGVAVIAILLFAFFMWRRRKNGKVQEYREDKQSYRNLFGLRFLGHRRQESQPNRIDPIYGSSPHPPAPTPYITHHAPQRSFGESSSGYGGIGNALLGTSESADSTTPQAPPLPRKGRALQPVRRHSSTPQQTRPVSSSSFQSPGSDVSSPDGATVLRAEVESLRREMDELRARGAYEPPPEYN